MDRQIILLRSSNRCLGAVGLLVAVTSGLVQSTSEQVGAVCKRENSWVGREAGEMYLKLFVYLCFQRFGSVHVCSRKISGFTKFYLVDLHLAFLLGFNKNRSEYCLHLSSSQ